MTNHMSRNVTFFPLVWPTIWSYIYVQIDMWPPYDQYAVTNMTNSYLTIIWPTHFGSKHLTNHTTKIVISTYLIICSGLNIKCQRFILLFISHFPRLLRCRHIVLCAVAIIGHLHRQHPLLPPSRSVLPCRWKQNRDEGASAPAAFEHEEQQGGPRRQQSRRSHREEEWSGNISEEEGNGLVSRWLIEGGRWHTRYK